MKGKITLPQQKQRAGALSLKEFYTLSTEQYNEYILQLFDVPVSERTDVDKHILKYHCLRPVQLIEEYFLDF